MEKKASARVYYLDWLRVVGTLAILVYHSSRFFNMGDWHVKNPVWYPWVEVWNRFATTWLMPLMFVISGASLFYALGKGAPTEAEKGNDMSGYMDLKEKQRKGGFLTPIEHTIVHYGEQVY